jgi:hypothetical protein
MAPADTQGALTTETAPRTMTRDGLRSVCDFNPPRIHPGRFEGNYCP